MTGQHHRVLVINPNSDSKVTAGLAKAIAPLAVGGLEMVTSTVAEAPKLISTDEDVAGVIPLLLQAVKEREVAMSVDAIIIACFSDPGVAEARTQLSLPILGIAESAYCAAMALGGRFGIISIHPSSVGRHDSQLDRLGFKRRRAGDRPVDLADIPETPDHETVTLDRLIAVGRLLIDQDGADSVILGCTGLAGYRGLLADHLGVPVIDPTIAAVGLARLALAAGPAAERSGSVAKQALML